MGKWNNMNYSMTTLTVYLEIFFICLTTAITSISLTRMALMWSELGVGILSGHVRTELVLLLMFTALLSIAASSKSALN